ncbi:Glycosyl transferases group 1, partial [Candidatus Electrothrix marina]
VGRLSIEKGLTYLIKAGERLAQAGVPFYIFVIGDGPQEEEIQQIVTEYGLEEKIIFVGFQKDVSALLPAFDIFLLPSLTEGTSMALLEAMACGLPVIATAVGGTPNVIISEENGILVPSKSPEAIVQAVIRLVENKELCQRMGHAALQTIESEYSLHSWLKKIDDIYTVVIQSKR